MNTLTTNFNNENNYLSNSIPTELPEQGLCKFQITDVYFEGLKEQRTLNVTLKEMFSWETKTLSINKTQLFKYQYITEQEDFSIEVHNIVQLFKIINNFDIYSLESSEECIKNFLINKFIYGQVYHSYVTKAVDFDIIKFYKTQREFTQRQNTLNQKQQEYRKQLYASV
jgi:hypothetical protein